MASKISGGPLDPLFTTKVLGKYEVNYLVCRETGFIQTESPYWLDEAYSDAITALDLGLISRNFKKAALTTQIVENSFPDATTFLDYGGGYGIFTRLMRDRGFAYTHYDSNCQNLFAKGFEIRDLNSLDKDKFDVLTAWEVFEHLTDPLESLDEMLKAADTVLFSTELVPTSTIRSAKDWWYFTPETGQHISFYTHAALKYIAKRLSLHLYTDGRSNHVLSKRAATTDPFKQQPAPTLLSRIRKRLSGQTESATRVRSSLLPQDFQQALLQLNAEFGADNACTD